MPNPSVCVVWTGKNPPEECQLEHLKKLLGDYVLHQKVWIEDVDDFIEWLDRRCPRSTYQRRIVVAILPLTIVKMLAERQEEAGFELWRTNLETVDEDLYYDVAIALHKALLASGRCTILHRYHNSRGVFWKVKEFKGYRHVKRVVIEEEEVKPSI